MQTDGVGGEATPWWGRFRLEQGTGARWDVGPATLWLYRGAREWRALYRPAVEGSATDPMTNRSEATVPVDDDAIEAVLYGQDEDVQVTRYGFAETEADIELQPALADRPVVSRPEHPFQIPAGEKVTLYVSTPLWMCVTLPETDRLLGEFPSHRMSDTWFGPSTTEGEFCYATRTAGRLRLESLPVRLHRAVTPVTVKNAADDSLFFEWVQLPVRHLAIYREPNDALWTDTVRMTRSSGSEGAKIQIRTGAPDHVDEAERIQSARDAEKQGLFTSGFRVFGALFGEQ